MRAGDVVVGAFPGAHITKTRPAVVLTTELYHQYRPDVVVGLITTQAPMPSTPTDCVLLDWKQAALHSGVLLQAVSRHSSAAGGPIDRETLRFGLGIGKGMF